MKEQVQEQDNNKPHNDTFIGLLFTALEYINPQFSSLLVQYDENGNELLPNSVQQYTESYNIH